MNHVDAFVRDGVLLVMLGVALYTDLTRGKVYDWLTIPVIVFGLLISLFAGSAEPAQGNALLGFVGRPFLASLAGLVLAFLVFGFAYLMHMLGGGDVKLMGAVGALMGLGFFLDAAVLTACAGAVVAVVVLVWRGRLWAGLKSSVLVFVAPRRFREHQKNAPPGAAEMTVIPYTIAIVVGTGTAWILAECL